ncbi:hypothetical protein [Mycobacterium sp. E136]|uniref:hypothetical protein n=1 Tax=Mycobacterium sp. E136 TaxID=1834125 RepID=UPI000A07608D|nr:hypothetical protein [Mycobacterium sp. E136]
MTDCRHCRPSVNQDPALHCHLCGHHIGARRTHYIVRRSFVLCATCLEGRPAHDKMHPDCPQRWHDLFDHEVRLATRGGAWRVLQEAL